MERKPDIQYVHQFYIHGSEAKVLELKPAKRQQKTKLPQALPQKVTQVRLDILSLCGIIVAVSLLVCMLVGMSQLKNSYYEHQQLEQYVIGLQNENIKLEQDYRNSYDLDDIREKALAIGLIPLEQAKTVAVQIVIPQPEPEPTFWESIAMAFEELFA